MTSTIVGNPLGPCFEDTEDTNENFHITLAFLGNIAEGSLEQISQMELKPGGISLNANFPGFFSKPGIGFLGIEINESLEALKDDIYRQLPKGIKASRQHKFVPHITLFRGLGHPMSAPLIEPNFTLTFDQVHLFESLQHNNRVTYRSVIRWK